MSWPVFFVTIQASCRCVVYCFIRLSPAPLPPRLLSKSSLTLSARMEELAERCGLKLESLAGLILKQPALLTYCPETVATNLCAFANLLGQPPARVTLLLERQPTLLMCNRLVTNHARLVYQACVPLFVLSSEKHVLCRCVSEACALPLCTVHCFVCLSYVWFPAQNHGTPQPVYKTAFNTKLNASIADYPHTDHRASSTFPETA